MREIKFRAWNGKEVGTVLAMFPGRGQTLQVAFDGGLKIVVFNSNRNEYHLMQYTGLKDKNGIDVYEGDILDFEPSEWGGRMKSAVTWDEQHACWDFGGGTASDVREFRQVVGNIYQNPELLGVKK